MQALYPDFKQVSPYGNIGDRKNDGYIKSTCEFFQVYAPNNINKNHSYITKTINKLNEDFNGLLEYWSKFSEIKNIILLLTISLKE